MLLLLAASPAFAQKFNAFPTNASPSVNDYTWDDTGTTSYRVQFSSIFRLLTFDLLGSGTNTSSTMVCGTGCFLSGNISASQINGVAIGINWTLTGTGPAGQLVQVTPTGCIGSSSNQIYISCMQLPSYTIAGLPTCNAGAQGLEAYVTNGQTSPTYLGAVSTTGSTVAPVFCNGTGWVYH
jgi:hypothetical protein